MRYAKPQSIDEALALLGDGRWRLLAGGTDFYPAQGARPFRDDILDINGLAALRHITQTQDHIVFGARASWSDVLQAELPPAFDALKLAAREVGSVQIQNTGTIAGNLCNASPAADGVPPLLVLDAEVELRASAAVRFVKLHEFILGNRRTALQPGEMVTAIRIPKQAARGASHFVKLGARRYLVISIAMVAVRLEVDAAGYIANAAIAVGACSPVALRLAGLEAALEGHQADVPLAELIEACDLSGLAPIDDVRGTALYRRDAARELVGRTLAGALAKAVASRREAAA